MDRLEVRPVKPLIPGAPMEGGFFLVHPGHNIPDSLVARVFTNRTDAAHIVKCVNSHAALVEALKYSRAAYIEVMASEFDFTTSTWLERCGQKDANLKKICAALTLAGEL